MTIPYTLRLSRKRKKTLSLSIGKNAEITVYAPWLTPPAEIDRFIDAKRAWIDKTIRKQTLLKASKAPKSYVTGETFYYLGQAYPLEAKFDPLEHQGLWLENGRFLLNCPEHPAMRRYYFEKWYFKKAAAYLPERVAHFSRLHQLAPGGVRITRAQSRWGSCSADNRLAFTFRLILATPAAIDYVVIHELMHIREKNHSSKFWRQVVEAMPQYAISRRWLRDAQGLFDL